MIHVVAGALFDAQGRVLIAQRPAGKHMAGGWEFPGGKRERGEEPRDTLVRELHEELGIEVHEAVPLIAYEHQYPHRRVLLDLWVVIATAASRSRSMRRRCNGPRSKISSASACSKPICR